MCDVISLPSYGLGVVKQSLEQRFYHHWEVATFSSFFSLLFLFKLRELYAVRVKNLRDGALLGRIPPGIHLEFSLAGWRHVCVSKSPEGARRSPSEGLPSLQPQVSTLPPLGANSVQARAASAASKNLLDKNKRVKGGKKNRREFKVHRDETGMGAVIEKISNQKP